VTVDAKRNIVSFFLTAEEEAILSRKHYKEGHHLANEIHLHILEEIKEEFVKEFGQDAYDKRVAELSRTKVQINEDNKRKAQEGLKKSQETREKIEKRIAKLEEKLNDQKQKAKADEMEKRKIIQGCEELERDNRL
jgi:uncharacterized protein (DUF2132 family)